MKGSSRVAGTAVCAALSVMLLSGVTASAVHAQTSAPPRGPGPNALQILVVPAFVSADKTLGCSAANEVRDHLDGDVDTKKDWVIQQDNIDETLKASGFPPCTPISATDDKQLTQQLRGVAFIDGSVAKTATGISIEPRIVLARDINEVQPLPAVEAAKVGDAAKQVSKEVLAAMKQYDGEEKCIQCGTRAELSRGDRGRPGGNRRLSAGVAGPSLYRQHARRHESPAGLDHRRGRGSAQG